MSPSSLAAKIACGNSHPNKHNPFCSQLRSSSTSNSGNSDYLHYPSYFCSPRDTAAFTVASKNLFHSVCLYYKGECVTHTYAHRENTFVGFDCLIVLYFVVQNFTPTSWTLHLRYLALIRPPKSTYVHITM